jgi:hypothetical protein
VRLNLPVIEATLRRVQREFDGIQRALGTPRDPMSGVVIDNVIAGYALLDTLLAQGTDPLAMGNLKQLLDLNTVVLCGTSAERRAAHARHVAATERRFYDDRAAGIEDLMDWHALHVDEPVWLRAAGVYVRVLSTPQLFIEGNHRTGALMMSWVLARHGQPPFVLSVDNAVPYFKLSAGIRDVVKGTAATFFRNLAPRRRLADLLAVHADRRYLLA